MLGHHDCIAGERRWETTPSQACRSKQAGAGWERGRSPAKSIRCTEGSENRTPLRSHSPAGWPYSPSTQEGAARVVPATCPGKQEHFTVWERSSILFLLQQRWAAMTSHVPGSTRTARREAGTRQAGRTRPTSSFPAPLPTPSKH